MAFTKARHHLVDGLYPHVFQGAIQEHGTVETRRMVAHFGDDIGMTQHHQRGIGIGTTGKATRVTGLFAATDLQG